jgi:hypothetical protein
MTSESQGTVEGIVIRTWYAYYKIASKINPEYRRQTHGWRETPLNPSYSFVSPSLCEDIQHVFVYLLAASLYKFTL